MVTKSKTKDRKIVIGGTIYIFRVPADTSLDALEIIKAGRILMIKPGIMACHDVNGNLLGNAGRAWNPAKPIFADPDAITSRHLLSAIERTKNLIDADIKHPNGKLPRLFSQKFQKKKIERDDTVPRYFIRSTAFCANCTEPIQGTQTIHPNSNGLVGSIDAFVPDPDTAVPVLGSKKWLHVGCAAKQVDRTKEMLEILSHVEPDSFTEKTKPDEELPPPKDDSPDTLLVTILKRQDMYSSEFARGAALMYACCKDIK